MGEDACIIAFHIAVLFSNKPSHKINLEFRNGSEMRKCLCQVTIYLNEWKKHS